MKTADLIGPALDYAVLSIVTENFKAYIRREVKEYALTTGQGVHGHVAVAFLLCDPEMPELIHHRVPKPGFENQLDEEGWPEFYAPSIHWSLGGPIIEREGIQLHVEEDHSRWIASRWGYDRQQYGPTPLTAAMRCYVASKLGDEIEIPKELT